MNTENSLNMDEPPSPIPRHVKWKMARTKGYGHMTSNIAKEISDKIDLLEEEMAQGRFVPHGQHDILNAAIGRSEHLGRVRVAGTGVTITQYFGHHSRASSSTSGSINPEQLVGLIKDLKEEWRREVEEESKQRIEKMKVELEEKNEKMKNEMEDKMTQKLKEAIKTELTQMATQKFPPVDALLQELAARVSTKGSGVETTVNPSGEENAAVEVPHMGLFVRSRGSTKLVALGKVYGGSSSIHNVTYADDVVRVTVEKIYDGDALVPYPTSEIMYVRETLHTFVAWPTHLVKPVSLKDAHTSSEKQVEAVNSSYKLQAVDPLDELMKNAYEVYHRPIRLSRDGFKFGIATVETSFFITHSDINEIISGDMYLNISILQLWIMFLDECSISLGYSSVYGFMES